MLYLLIIIIQSGLLGCVVYYAVQRYKTNRDLILHYIVGAIGIASLALSIGSVLIERMANVMMAKYLEFLIQLVEKSNQFST